ncbi:hypothetical protein IAU60_002060 [Kwoniella sp. DSM 27419]
MEIVIPNLEDDEDDYLPAFQKPSFGAAASSSTSLPESDPHAHRSNPSASSTFGPRGQTTPTRPVLPKAPASFSVGAPTPHPFAHGPSASHGFGVSRAHDDTSVLGKLNNGSSSSLVTAGTSIGSTSGFLAGRKGSLASIKNAFKSGSSNAHPVPPVPALDVKAYGAPGYPALRNPFSRFETPISPKNGTFKTPTSRTPGKHPSTSSPAQSTSHNPDGRKYSIASSHRSQGGRSMNSNGSSTFKPEDHVVPALPPIPVRQTPSRMGRKGSDAGSMFGMSTRGAGSLGGNEVYQSLGRTPGEEALKLVFGEFREAANQKVGRICARPLNIHPSLPSFLELGIDSTFDALVRSLAHCGIRHARKVVEVLMEWGRDHTGNISANEVRAHLDRSLGSHMRVEDAAAILQSRKASAARYIMNRALIELLKVVPKDSLDDELGIMLEQTAFTAYRSEKLEDTILFPHRRAVSQLQIELLGQLSTTRFLTVSDRFVRELGKFVTSTQPTKEIEAKIEHLLKGMRSLKLRVYPEAELELSSEFLQSLAGFFANTHGQNLKIAYAETLTSLLHPVVETATAEVNHPQWSKAVAIVLDRAMAMAQKARYWAVAFPLVITALGVSPRELLLQQWQSCMESIMVKFKDRNLRTIAMGAFIRLLWLYLNRCNESSTSMRKRLDPLIRACFPSYGQLYPAEIPSEPFISALHYIMTRHPDYGEELAAGFLTDRNADTLGERSMILVRAVNYTLRSLELERPSLWPNDPAFGTFDLEQFESSGQIIPFDSESKPEVRDLLKRCGPAFVDLLFQCDNAVKNLLLSNDSITLAGHSSSNALDNPQDQVTIKHGDVYVSYHVRHDPAFQLMVALVNIIPRCTPSDTNLPQLVNVLCRATFSANPDVCFAACDALRRLAQQPDKCALVTSTFREFVFETRHVFRDTFIGARLLESQFERIIQLWLSLLQAMVSHQRVAEAQAVDDDFTPNISPMEPHLINKVEGCALFLLCSTSAAIRRLANSILVAARDLEGQQRRPSAAFRYSRIVPDRSSLSRVLQIFEHSAEDSDIAAIRALPWMTFADKHRLELLTNKDKHKLLQRIAESDQAKDGALWAAVFPYFVARVAEQLPGPAQELRAVTSQLVLRLQAHVALLAGSALTRGTPGRGQASTRNTLDVAVLADHWRAYLTVLCITLSPPTTAPPTPVQRAKDVIILNQELISGPGFFQYLASLIGWDDPRFKDAAIYAMGSIRQDLLRPLSEVLLSVIRRLADGAKTGGTPRSDTASRRSPVTAHGSIWTAVAHVFRLISPLILNGKSPSHTANLLSVISFVRATHTLLSDRTVKDDFDLQGLRRSFCMTVDSLTKALVGLDPDPNRYFGTDVRGAIYKLCDEWCHLGRRPDVAKARESQVLQAAAEGYRGDRDRGQYLDDLQAKTKLLSAAAAEAMAGLCQGTLISASEATPAQQASDCIVEPLTVLRWIRGMLGSSATTHHDIGRRALFALIKYNGGCSRLLDEVLHQSFGEGEQFSLESSFFGVIADVILDGQLKLPIEQVACLALSKLGHPVLDIRQRAFQLTGSLYAEPADRLQSAAILPAIGSTSPSVYRQAQEEMSCRIAAVYAKHAFEFLKECTTRLSQLEAPRRQATLTILRPWMDYIDLASDTSELSREDAANEHQVLQDLVYLCVRFSDDHIDLIKGVLMTFAGAESDQPRSHESNTTALIKYLFEQAGKHKSSEFVAHAQRIIACLAQCPAGESIFQDMCNFVEPNAMAALPETEVAPSPMSSLANLDSLMSAPTARSQTYSTGQLALLFAGELLADRLNDFEVGKSLLSLLHAALVHVDHASTALRDQSQSVLFQVLRTWVCILGNVPVSDVPTIWSSAEAKISALTSTGPATFWKADDMGNPESAFLAPPKMTNMMMKILAILLPLQPRIRQQWGELALTWATTCPIRHLACRSFQVFRILSPRVSPRMVSDILARLSSTIASSSPEIQVFNREVLRTFASVVQSLSTTEAASYPQMFWCSMACLTTPYENEFVEVIELLSHILDKSNLSDPTVVQHLASFRPPDWTGPAPYLQSLLLIGLRSSKTVFMTFDLIRRLTSASEDKLIDSVEDRLLHGFVAALPWMLHSADVGEPNEELAAMALDLAAIADSQGNASFSRLLTSFARVRFRSQDDFVRQAASLLRDYMPTKAMDIVTLLLGFVLNPHDWMREKAMQMLKLVLQSPEARVPFQTYGHELLQPLLRLVSTKHASQSLDVLDTPATAMSPELTGTGSSDTRDEAVFGPISESGWSVPQAKTMSTLTQDNVHAVFNTCAVETRAASAHFSVVQFADLGKGNSFGLGFGVNPSQASFDMPSPPLSGPMAGRSTLGEMENPSMGDLVGALHSLGQFFDDGLDTAVPQGTATSPKNLFFGGSIGLSSGPIPERRRGHGPTGSDVSERRLRAIMARGHQASISSPIYETSPTQSIGPSFTRPFAHANRPSVSMTSESSMTSSVDERDATQRLGLSALMANAGRDGMNGYSRHFDDLDDLRAPVAPFALGARTQARHVVKDSTSTMSDVVDQNAFGLDEEGSSAGTGHMDPNASAVSLGSFSGRQAIWEGSGAAQR